MELRVLGCYGGEMPGYRTTCLMVDRKVLIDAGAITSALSLPDQQKIEAIVLSHCHLDHIRDLGFLADNIFGARDSPVRIFALPETIRYLKTHVLNNLVWPDFSQLPTPEHPVISFEEIREGETIVIEGLEFTPVRVHHTVATAGFIVKNQGSAFAFSGDTGPTQNLWKEAAKIKGLSTLIMETSFPDRLAQLAQVSGHLTPATARAEIQKLNRPGLHTYLFHLKPQYLREIISDLDADAPDLRPLQQDEQIEI
jgi:ribonuclease BN (tRNA processing enzyme)